MAQIGITTDKRMQVDAARALSAVLDALGIRHAVAGGFAVVLLGSKRQTKDIDFIVDLAPDKIKNGVRPQITQINPHFAQLGLQFYFAPTLVQDLAGEQLVFANRQNVIVEMLPTNFLGLPLAIDPSMVVKGEDSEEGSGLPILHPSIILLSKLKRIAATRESTWPRAVLKRNTDTVDVEFLVQWLVNRGLKISIAGYNAAEPERLYQALKAHVENLKKEGMEEGLGLLRQVVTDEDWQRVAFGDQPSSKEAEAGSTSQEAEAQPASKEAEAEAGKSVH